MSSYIGIIKKSLPRERADFSMLIHLKQKYYDNLFTYNVNLDFKFPALFLWIIFRLANLSSMELTSGNNLTAVSLSVVARNLRTALRAVLA